MDFLQSPEFLGILGTILTAFISFASFMFTRYTGVQIEKKYRDDLHEAIISGVASAQRYGVDAGMDTVKAHVRAHLRSSVPDALKALTPGDGVLDTLVERYWHQWIEGKLAPTKQPGLQPSGPITPGV